MRIHKSMLLASMFSLTAIDLGHLGSTGPVVFKRPRGKRLARLRYGDTGRPYPFSSKRQWMRNARQIAAGKLQMDGVPTFKTAKAAQAYATQFDEV